MANYAGAKMSNQHPERSSWIKPNPSAFGVETLRDIIQLIVVVKPFCEFLQSGSAQAAPKAGVYQIYDLIPVALTLSSRNSSSSDVAIATIIHSHNFDNHQPRNWLL